MSIAAAAALFVVVLCVAPPAASSQSIIADPAQDVDSVGSVDDVHGLTAEVPVLRCIFTVRCCGRIRVQFWIELISFEWVNLYSSSRQVYANSVMRGTPVCKKVVPNGFRKTAAALCGAANSDRLSPGEYSIRLTGTLSASSPQQWHNFSITVGPTALARLWVDDHRLVDAWSPRPIGDTNTPTTPGLLPNVTMGSQRPVFVRVDLRPMDDSPVQFALSWAAGSAAAHVLIPSEQFSPEVSSQQSARRDLQEAAATGWNHWARRSQLAQIALPQQVGVELSIKNSSGAVYSGALPEPQRTQVRMGVHAYDGSFSSISVVPFPDAPVGERANITVETAHVPSSSRRPSLDVAAASGEIGDCVIVVHTNSSAELSLVVQAEAFWGAAARITANPANNTVTMQSGDLGSITVSVSGGVVTVDPESKAVAIVATFAGPSQAVVISLSFTGTVYSDADALRAISMQRAAAEKSLAAGSKRAGGLSEAYDAMSTVIAWNVNFDPRVAVTCPVSRTFESAYDFIFFDWDM